jgi:hydrogenase nickel incorporation protein HypA/HybF
MHEVSLVSSLVEQIEATARKEVFEKVLRIRLAIGALSGVEPACVEFCFPEVARGSVLEGAELTIDRIDLRLHCQVCEKDSSSSDFIFFVCAHCGSVDVKIENGKEFRVVDMDVI